MRKSASALTLALAATAVASLTAAHTTPSAPADTAHVVAAKVDNRPGPSAERTAFVDPGQALCGAIVREAIASQPWAAKVTAGGWTFDCAPMGEGAFGQTDFGAKRITMSQQLVSASIGGGIERRRLEFWAAHEAGHAELAAWPQWKTESFEQATGRPLYGYARPDGSMDWDAYLASPGEHWARGRAICSTGEDLGGGQPSWSCETLRAWSAWEGER